MNGRSMNFFLGGSPLIYLSRVLELAYLAPVNI